MYEKRIANSVIKYLQENHYNSGKIMIRELEESDDKIMVASDIERDRFYCFIYEHHISASKYGATLITMKPSQIDKYLDFIREVAFISKAFKKMYEEKIQSIL